MKNVWLYDNKNCLSPTAPEILTWGSMAYGGCDYISRIPIESARRLVAKYDERCWRQGGQVMIETRNERQAETSEAA